MIGWGRNSSQNASTFSATARDGDDIGCDLVDMRVRYGWWACFVVDIKAVLSDKLEFPFFHSYLH